jgi:dihydroflavonol-4-reductase
VRALVTGAAGFIGVHVVRALTQAGADVVAFDRSFANHQLASSAARVELIEGDVLEPDALRRAMADCDAVFHLAAVYSYRRADAALMQGVNVEGTRAVLEAAAHGRQRRVIHTSSCATCGPVAGRLATEQDLPTAADLAIPYKRTKLAGERLVLDAASSGMDALVVNPTVPVGPGDLRPTPTGKMVADVASGRAGGYLANSSLNIVAVEDVAAGHLRAYEHGRGGERYLLGGENLTIREVFGQIATAVGRPAPRIGVPWPVAYAAARVADAALRPLSREPRMLLLDEVRSGRLPHLFDDGKARTDLGYSSRPAAEALAAAARDTLANPREPSH